MSIFRRMWRRSVSSWVSPELVGAHLHVLQVQLQADALLLQAGGIAVHQAVDLGLHHGLGQLNVHLLAQLGQQGLAELRLTLGHVPVHDLLLQVLFELSQGLKLGDILGKLIVDGGDLLLLHLDAFYFELDRLAGQILA